MFTPRKEYELRVQERNDARRELAEAQAWIQEARIALDVLGDMMARAGAVDVEAHLRELLSRCPLPEDHDAPLSS
jgi:hypothetical protein